MEKDLTECRTCREKILNNKELLLILMEWCGVDQFQDLDFEVTPNYLKEDVLRIFEIDEETFKKCVSEHKEELKVLGCGEIVSFKACIDLAMLLKNNETAKQFRLDILKAALDLVNKKTGGGTLILIDEDEEEWEKNVRKMSHLRTGLKEYSKLEWIMSEYQYVLKRLKMRG